MSELSFNEITRDGKEYRSELLIGKIFDLKLSNDFHTKKGLFHAESIMVGYTTYKGNKDAKQQKEIVEEIFNLKELPVSQRNLVLSGKLAGQTTSTEIKITELTKTEEFGGQPAGGRKVNKGIQFEKDLEARLVEICNGVKPKGKYADQAAKIIEICSNDRGSPVIGVLAVGSQNQKRPLVSTGDQLYIAPADHRGHGEKLTDITLKHKNGKFSYLSLKFGGTLTFVNAGVAAAFSAAEIKKKKITNATGKAILKTFNVDEMIFYQVFNDYGKNKKFPSKKTKINAAKLKKFLQTAIGSNYYMVHGMGGDKVYFWEMSPEKNLMFASVGGDVEIQYGGSSGTGKRVDIIFSNNYFDFKINIRNKQSGVYPSHIMCDYKSKNATGKKLL